MRSIILALPLTLAAADGDYFRTDQPDRWYDPEASHHQNHALLLGAPTGLATYVGLRLAGCNRPWSWLGAGVGAGLVGLAYELDHAPDGAYRDPVDVAWTAAGGFAVAALAWQVDRFSVSPVLGNGVAGVAMRVDF